VVALRADRERERAARIGAFGEAVERVTEVVARLPAEIVSGALVPARSARAKGVVALIT